MIGIYYGNGGAGVLGIHSLDFDATLEEVHDFANEVTTNPVESGAPIADHVVEKPDKLRLTGIITNSPLRGPLAGQYFGGDTQSPRTQTAFEALYALVKAREPVIVYTRHAIYADMVIQTINIPRNASIGEAIEFSMELVHIRVVNTQVVSVPPGISAKKSAKSTAAVGNKTEPQKSAGQVALDSNYKQRGRGISVIEAIISNNSPISYKTTANP